MGYSKLCSKRGISIFSFSFSLYFVMKNVVRMAEQLEKLQVEMEVLKKQTKWLKWENKSGHPSERVA